MSSQASNMSPTSSRLCSTVRSGKTASSLLRMMRTEAVGTTLFRRYVMISGASAFRVPGIMISPFVRKGAIDNHEYETVSILKLIERRYHLAPLAARDADPAVSDLTTAFGRVPPACG